MDELVLHFKGMFLILVRSTKQGVKLIGAAAALPDFEVPNSSIKVKPCGYPSQTDGKPKVRIMC